MISVKRHLTLLVSVMVLVLLVSMPVLGSEHGEQLESINWVDLIARIVELFAILLEEAAKGIRNGLDYLLEILEVEEQQ